MSQGVERKDDCVTVLAVDDDPHGLAALEALLEHSGFQVLSASNGNQAIEVARSGRPDLILLDVQMPGPDGLSVTRILKSDEATRYIPIVLLTAKDTLADILSGFEAGADDYIRKPYNERELLARVHASVRARRTYLELRDVVTENVHLRKISGGEDAFSGIIGNSEAIQSVFRVIERMSKAHAPVLITGESGTGKELVAKAIHALSPRSKRNFVAQNVAALSDTLLESELFGHIKGAFTGALKDRRGLFETADNGTLFLDEVGEMTPQLQAKLLRVLQDGTFNPVGDTKSRTVDVRVVAATHRDLERMIREGTFREDLYYRLNVIRIELPPLRERRGDIPLLAEHFLAKAVLRNGTDKKRLSAELLRILSDQNWSGNVRELQNEVERLVLMSGHDEIITKEHLSRPLSAKGKAPTGKLKDAMENLERLMILECLKAHDWNKSEVARELGISRSSLITKVQNYRLADEQS